MSFSETIFLFFLALIIFGPKKLPEIARQVGKVLNEFRRASNEFKSQIEQEIAHLEVENNRKTALAPSPTPAGTESRSLLTASAEEIAKTEPPATLAASSETAAPHPSEVLATEASPAVLPENDTTSLSQAGSETGSEAQPELHAESSASPAPASPSPVAHQADPQESHA